MRVLISSPINSECCIEEARNYLAAGHKVVINLKTILSLEWVKEIKESLSKEIKAGKVEFVYINTDKSSDIIEAFQKDGLGFDAITTRPYAKMTKEVIEQVRGSNLQRQLRFIGCSCVGFNHIDIETATKHNIVVFNSPGENSISLARLIMTQLDLLHRNIKSLNDELLDNRWNRNILAHTTEMHGKTLGVVGAGASGSLVIKHALESGMEVIVLDTSSASIERAKKIAQQVGKEITIANSLGHLLKNSDTVSLHVPYNDYTKFMIGEREIKQMKKGSFIIASATRGDVVDEQAVANAIKSGHLAGAAFDVFSNEKFLDENNKISSPLMGLDRVILTPHVGCITPDIVKNVVDQISRAIILGDHGDFRSSVINDEVLEKIGINQAKRYNYADLKGKELSPAIKSVEQFGTRRLIPNRPEPRSAKKILSKMLSNELDRRVSNSEIPRSLEKKLETFLKTDAKSHYDNSSVKMPQIGK